MEDITLHDDLLRKIFYRTVNGKIVQDNDDITSESIVTWHVRVLGGKGGFGSMLRAMGARMQCTTNNDACRDLSGRRVRDVNNEKQIGNWLKQQDAADDERDKRRAEKLERILKPTHAYDDRTYTTSLQENASSVEDAMKYASGDGTPAQGAVAGSKRGGGSGAGKSTAADKRMRMWMQDEEGSSEEEEEEEEAENEAKEEEELPIVPEAENASANVTANDANPSIVDFGTSEQDQQIFASEANDCSTVDANVPLAGEVTSENGGGSGVVPVESPSVVGSSTEKTVHEPIDLSIFKSAEMLESVGLVRLKLELQNRGMKCGGTLKQRAERLFQARDQPVPDQKI